MFCASPYRHTAYGQVGPGAAAGAPQPVDMERGEARPGVPIHLVPATTPYSLNLADVEAFYVRESVKIVKSTRAMLMKPQGRAAATKLVGHRDDETPLQFAARVVSTAPPRALFFALAAGGVSKKALNAAFHCCWLLTALRFAKRCRELPNPPFDRVGTRGQTILGLAINDDAELAVFWLIRSGASPRAPTENNKTALSLCVACCQKHCKFAIDECVHERMKILMLCDAGNPPAGYAFADAMYSEMTRADTEPNKRKRNS
jgi:hypothetical protein